MILARAQRADLIVVGKHGQSRLGEVLLGTLSGTIVEQAPADVLVVPPGSCAPPSG